MSVDAQRNEATFSLSMSSGPQTLRSFVTLDLHALSFVQQEYVDGPLPGVPEPSSYLLLLGGLGVVGLFAHRKASVH
ncbi:MAG TPA: PEP-CTERM sorting domain-containing protein [Rubrivivax sp.]